MALMGIVLVGYGTWEEFKTDEPIVEIIREEQEEVQEDTAMIMVDVGGAVVNPVVFELSSGARVGEALAAAGGLSEKSDKAYVSKHFNLAQELPDGGKICVPGISENSEDSEGQIAGLSDSQIVGTLEGQSGGKVNINTASVSEFDSLWGIG
jgi:competence protein ComEA